MPNELTVAAKIAFAIDVVKMVSSSGGEKITVFPPVLSGDGSSIEWVLKSPYSKTTARVFVSEIHGNQRQMARVIKEADRLARATLRQESPPYVSPPERGDLGIGLEQSSRYHDHRSDEYEGSIHQFHAPRNVVAILVRSAERKKLRRNQRVAWSVFGRRVKRKSPGDSTVGRVMARDGVFFNDMFWIAPKSE